MKRILYFILPLFFIPGVLFAVTHHQSTSAPVLPINDPDLLGLWYFENDATDESANGNDLTPVNTPAYGTTTPPQGTYYTSLSVGTDNHFTSSSTDFQVAGSFTIMAWIYPGNATSTIFRKYGTDPEKGFFLKILSTGAVNFGLSSDGSDWTGAINSDASVITFTTWSHIALVYDGEYLRLYLDGSEYTNTYYPYYYTDGLNPSTADLVIGNEWNGRLDAAAIFDRALTGAEVLNIKNNGFE